MDTHTGKPNQVSPETLNIDSSTLDKRPQEIYQSEIIDTSAPSAEKQQEILEKFDRESIVI